MPPQETFYITTAIDYPNSVPHMGHAYEKTVADFYARWYRQRGLDTRFLTGLDEHGQKIQEAADRDGASPQAFVDEKAVIFRALCKQLDLSNDDFIRTSEDRHHRFAAEIWKRVEASGDIYFGHYEGRYCISCESFYTPTQLVDGKCPVHGRPTDLVKEESYFFRLGKYRDWIREHIRTHESFIYPPERRNEIVSRLDEDVLDLSVSRSTFDWGIPVPGNAEHVMYVWFDALSNYVSALWDSPELHERFWPADVHVIGKDISWFHSVIWPCMLHSAGLAIPRQVYVHGFILDENGRKMAKHLGNVVDPLAIIEELGADVLRFYFLRVFSSGHDGKFSPDDLRERYQSELGNDLGNLVLRVAKLVEGRLGGALAAPPGVDNDLDPEETVRTYARYVDRREHHRALEALWSLIRRTNAYLNERAPWKSSDPGKAAPVLYNALEALRATSYLLQPAMPRTARSIAGQLGVEIPRGALPPFGQGEFTVRRGKALFPRMESSTPEASPSPKPASSPRTAPPPAGGTPPFARLDLRVGRIEAVRAHPDADSLYVLEVSLSGSPDAERRTICAGLRAQLSTDELSGRKVVIVANLKPARLRGIESHGMVLATDRRDGKVAPVDPGGASPGTRVTVEGIEPRPKKKLSIRDFEKVSLTMEGGRVVCDGAPLLADGDELRCDAEDGSPVR